MCDRWANSFSAFLQDMGERKPGTTLERINNDRDYEPGNCKWATMRDQSNNRVDNVKITMRGKTQTVAQWCRETGTGPFCAYQRLKRGWSPEKTFSTPLEVRPRVKYEGKWVSIPWLSLTTGIPRDVICSRLRAGWGTKRTIQTPWTGKRKLSAEDVKEIRRRAAQGESQSSLAKAFGVCQSNISRTVNNQRNKTL